MVLIKIVPVFIAVLFFLIVPFAQAATLASLEVLVLAPGMEQTISARLDEEFALNGNIRQRALIAEKWGDYENLVVELNAVRNGSGGPEADLKINVLKNGVPITWSIFGMGEGTEKKIFDVELELTNFVKEGGDCVGAKFVAHSQPMWSNVFFEIMRRAIFVF